MLRSMTGRLALQSPVFPASPRVKVAQAETNWFFSDAIVKFPHLEWDPAGPLTSKRVFQSLVKIGGIITLASKKKDPA